MIFLPFDMLIFIHVILVLRGPYSYKLCFLRKVSSSFFTAVSFMILSVPQIELSLHVFAHDYAFVCKMLKKDE